MHTTQDTPDEPWTPSLLDPRTIHPHPMNPRTSSHADEGLVASVKEMGVLERLVLAPVPADLPEHARNLLEEDADFLLIAGHRRLDAALVAGMDLVPVDVRHDLDTLEKQLAAIAAENVHRSDLTALEEGDLYLALGGLGLTQKAISDRTSVDKGRVSERTRVAKLPAPARERLASRQITLEAALTLAKIVDDPDQVARIATQPPYVWDQEVRRVLAAKERAREEARQVKDFAAAGVTVLDEFPPTPDVEDDDPETAAAPWWRLDDLLDACYDRMSLAVVKHHGLAPDAEEYEGVDLEFEQIEAWHQATCTGHAVVRTTVKSWEGETTRWVTICTTPAAHDDLLDADETPDGLSLATDPDAFHTAAGRNTPEDDEQQEAPEVAARRAHLEARVDQHTRWLAKVLEQNPPTLHERALAATRSRLPRYELTEDGDLLATWHQHVIDSRRVFLGLPDDAKASHVEQEFHALADRLDIGQLCLLHDLTQHGPAYGAHGMTTPGGFTMGWAEDRVHLLQDLGWVWDDQELDEIRKHPKLAASLGIDADEDAPAEGEVA